MELNVNKIYKQIFFTDARYILIYGGRAAGRSYVASQKVILNTTHDKYSRAAVMRYILGDVRSSIWQEIKDRIEENELPPVVSDQMMHYEYGTNSIDGKGFKKSTGQNIGKMKSLASYNMVVIEEADEISEDDFNNLDSSIRTLKGQNVIILLFNMPPKEHWIIKRWFNLIAAEVDGFYKALPNNSENTEYIFSDYHNNRRNLSDILIRTYENYKTINPEYYYTMIKGYVSEGLKGRIFTTWQPISNKEYEELPYPTSYGLDFGFTNDPTALIEFKSHNSKIYLKELIYETGLTNDDIVQRMQTLKVNGKIVADSAEPKSIEEIKRAGYHIIPSVKGPDSIRSGINLLLQYEVYYTNDSKGIETETQNYIYKLDRLKNPTNEPIDAYNHGIDASRYIATDQLTKKSVKLSWV